MDKGLHNSIFNHDDCVAGDVLLKYAHNELSSIDKNKVEKHLLDCELCSDALEGLQMVKNRDVVASLKNEVAEKFGGQVSAGTTKGKIIKLEFKTVLAIAASVALLIVSVYVFNKSLKDEKVVADSKVTEDFAEEILKMPEPAKAEEYKSDSEPAATTPAATKIPDTKEGNKLDGIFAADKSEEKNSKSESTKIVDVLEDAIVKENAGSALSGGESSAVRPAEEQAKSRDDNAGAEDESVMMRASKDEKRTEVNTSSADKEKKTAKKAKLSKAAEPAVPSSVQAQQGVSLSSTTVPGNDTDNESISNSAKEAHTDSLQVFTIVEEMPQYPGGEVEMTRFIKENTKYPQSAKDNNIQGTVYISFVVEKDGSIKAVKIQRGIAGCNECNAEALRVINLMPKWMPGKQSGKTVRVSYVLPVKFKL